MQISTYLRKCLNHKVASFFVKMHFIWVKVLVFYVPVDKCVLFVIYKNIRKCLPKIVKENLPRMAIHTKMLINTELWGEEI